MARMAGLGDVSATAVGGRKVFGGTARWIGCGALLPSPVIRREGRSHRGSAGGAGAVAVATAEDDDDGSSNMPSRFSNRARISFAPEPILYAPAPTALMAPFEHLTVAETAAADDVLQVAVMVRGAR